MRQSQAKPKAGGRSSILALAMAVIVSGGAAGAQTSCDSYWSAGDAQYERGDAIVLRVESSLRALRGISLTPETCEDLRAHRRRAVEAIQALQEAAENYRKSVYACADAYNSTRDPYYLDMSDNAAHNRDLARGYVGHAQDMRGWLTEHIARCN